MVNFEADLTPPNPLVPKQAGGWPRLRFNFSNGWSASVVIRTGRDKTSAQLAALACAPTSQWQEGKTELGSQEAFPDEVIAYLAEVAARPKP